MLEKYFFLINPIYKQLLQLCVSVGQIDVNAITIYNGEPFRSILEK